MDKVTIDSVTSKQIRALRRESLEAGDHMMAAICDVALFHEFGEGDDEPRGDDYSTLKGGEAARLDAMGGMAARRECVDVINAAIDAGVGS